ncbi:MAG: capsule biosynthesis protein [Erythrobacter sp.]
MDAFATTLATDADAASSPAQDRTPVARNILLLQGIMGPFFRELGMALRAAGHTVFKVNFNGGDRAYWRLPNGIDFRGQMEQWPKFFAGLLQAHNITDIMLFGDCRPHHVTALALCREHGVTAYVFEEGYIRPDWVTMELGGVNGYSTLPRDPDWYRSTAAQLPPIAAHQKVSSSFRRRATEGFAYNAADVLSRWRYRGWENHRPWHPVVEGMGWARKLSRRKRRRKQAEELIARLLTSGDRYFLFPLQLDSDAQIRLHSPFAGIAHALKDVLTSFTHHAPRDVRLVIKEHPLDNGVRDWELEARDLASRLGIAERVDYLASGDIETVSQYSQGMVTINSTSGSLALAQGIPVVVLGTAIYDMADLTHQTGLDRFWNEPERPDIATFHAFQRVLIDRCLIPGGFFSAEAIEKVVRHAVARFEGRFLAPD